MIATYPRAYERAVSLHDPVLVVHQLAAKPRAWAESEIRSEMPGMLRDWLDGCDPDDPAASREAVVKAASCIIGMHEPGCLHAQQLTPHCPSP